MVLTLFKEEILMDSFSWAAAAVVDVSAALVHGKRDTRIFHSDVLSSPTDPNRVVGLRDLQFQMLFSSSLSSIDTERIGLSSKLSPLSLPVLARTSGSFVDVSVRGDESIVILTLSKSGARGNSITFKCVGGEWSVFMIDLHQCASHKELLDPIRRISSIYLIKHEGFQRALRIV
ncbi:MAG: hypothetical protein O2904_00685 [bacterium]|nr:hypothetical protein [bacterium]